MVVASNRYPSRPGAILAATPQVNRNLAAVVISLALAVHVAPAQVVQWVGPPGQLGMWNDPANWSSDVPDGNSDVVFDSGIPGQPALVDLSGANLAAAGTLSIKNGGVQFFGAGVLNVSSNVTIGGANHSPKFIVASGAVVNALGNVIAVSGEACIGVANSPGSLNVAGNLVVGDVLNESPATILVEGGSTASAGYTSLQNGNIAIRSGGVLSITQGLTIGAEGALNGDGTVHGSVTNSGLVEPGDSIGELTIDGDYIQLVDGELQIELAGNTADRLVVSDSVTYGGTLRLLVTEPLGVGQQQEVISAGADFLGEFERVVIPHTPGRGLSVTIDGLVAVTGSGDVDLNGTVNHEDIDDFVVALVNPDLYLSNYGLFNSTVADFAEVYGVLDLFDVPGFEQALRDAGVEVSIAALLNIPEPISLIQAEFAMLLLVIYRMEFQRALRVRRSSRLRETAGWKLE